ncbi:MAG: hypothetical protein Q4A11_06185 [Brachymonas sp.]|nr:hypothetical protein [Brachymonas sp.]
MGRKLLEKRAWDFAQNLVGQLIAPLGAMRIDAAHGAKRWRQAVADSAWNLRPFQYQLPYPFGNSRTLCARRAWFAAGACHAPASGLAIVEWVALESMVWL